MSSPTSTIPAQRAFESRVKAVKTPKHDINALILDYLLMEGYPKAAANFSKEANLRPMNDCYYVEARQEIQNAIHRGSIDEAISQINTLDPTILDQDEGLHFTLLRLQLVELIRNSGRNEADIDPVIKFAQDQLAPRASTRKEFLKQLEETMVMLFFLPEKMPPEQQKLLSPDLRREVADKVNKAILHHYSTRREAAIRQIVKMRAWTENAARDNKKDLPDFIDIGLQVGGDDGKESRLHDHEHEAMVIT